MTLFMKPVSRRGALKGGIAAAAAIAAPSVLRAAEPPAVKVGILQPVTGALAMDGEFGRTGAELAIADINAAGGIKALGGAKIEMVFGDARSNPEAGVQEVERMQSEGVAAIVGGFASPICLAATQAAARYDLPYIVDVGVSDQIIQRGLKNTFRFAPGFAICTQAAIQNLVRINEAAGKPAKTIALVHEDGLFGSGLAKLMQTELPKHGFEIAETIAIPTPSRDLSNVALRLRSLNPDLVIPSTYYGETVLLARTMQQQRVRPKAVYAVLNGAASNMRFVKEFPEAAENIMDVNHWQDPRNPKNAELQKRVVDAGKQWNYNTPLNYSCVMLLADAIERAGSADRAKLIDSIAASTYDKHLMPYGPTKFVGGQNQGAAPVSTQVQKATIRVVYPEAFSDAKPIFPVRG
ncbi:ABC transporter substrate-binding protein [Chelatococcus asaccharovorans]|uniref:Amino acid/amide ABC transporter substrate-binding protein (HAAT family) n=1 Tax=Chelatococcus asaccharovorans TaxID=28210 RepID=A0A2V3UHY1_9HYPH|nr:ABC transporter substrate-binding protein [Chelatococcus asaccharovorans]MBS7706577.1 ABC transporter substrate-binding protein [Chelatococcus asaccharovorans]PXW64776.1 amino acid/amide ABC transporter substrate-binding protein (HAAT family) [Chelatococcus asaccharovorans]